MHKIKIAELSRYYNNAYGRPPKKFNNEDLIWMVDIDKTDLISVPLFTEVLGISDVILTEAAALSQKWCGWGFYTLRLGRDLNISYTTLPVLLFESAEDAVLARLRWSPNRWVNM